MSEQAPLTFGKRCFVPPLNTVLLLNTDSRRYDSPAGQAGPGGLASVAAADSAQHDAPLSAGAGKQVRWSDEGIADCSPATSPSTHATWPGKANPTTAAAAAAVLLEEVEECDGRSVVSSNHDTTGSCTSSMPSSPSRKRSCPTLDVFSAKRHEGMDRSRPDPMLWMLDLKD
jgi:hypothetical protein